MKISITMGAYEVAPYLAVLLLGLHLSGVAGATTAFTLRVFSDNILLSAQFSTLRPTFLLTLCGLAFLGTALLLTQQSVSTPVIASAGLVLYMQTIIWSVAQATTTHKQQIFL